VVKKYVCIPRSFLAINVCNQGKTLRSPCIIIHWSSYLVFCCNLNLQNEIFNPYFRIFLREYIAYPMASIHTGQQNVKNTDTRKQIFVECDSTYEPKLHACCIARTRRVTTNWTISLACKLLMWRPIIWMLASKEMATLFSVK
jgi:hypothetical protein